MDLVSAFVVYVIFLYGSDRFLASRGHRGPKSDHFDGKRFFSYGHRPKGKHTPKAHRSFLRWALRRPKNPWKWRENRSSSRPVARVMGRELVVTFVNHSTFLIQTAGLNILTDPVWSKRASPFPFLGPKRFRAPGIRLEDLPPIDIVLISHNHYDHMDLHTLRRITKAHHPEIFVGLGNAAYLDRKGIEGARDMDWWDEAHVRGATIVCAPAQHFSSRAISDRNMTLWNGFIIRTDDGDIYFAGDTGFGEFVDRIRSRFSGFRLALLPIGAFRPEWFMGPVHASPEEAMRMHHLLAARTTIGMHHSTFKLADDKQDEPLERIRAMISRAHGEKPNFLLLENGETAHIA